ncbi:hypothetical protein BH09BAC4_BH09BAC4_13140 [soil metagenome]
MNKQVLSRGVVSYFISLDYLCPLLGNFHNVGFRRIILLEVTSSTKNIFVYVNLPCLGIVKNIGP